MADNYKSVLNGTFAVGSKEDAPTYLAKSGRELLSDQDAIADVRSYYASNGVYFNNVNEMWDKFYTDQRWGDTNTISMGLDALEFATASDNDKEQLSRLSKLWAQAPSRGSVLDKVVDYGLAGVADPTNLVGLGVGGATVKAGQAARIGVNTLDQARKAATKAGVKSAFIKEGALGAGIGAGFDAAQQAREIQTGVSEEFSGGRLLAAGLLDAGVSGAAGAGLAKLGSMINYGQVAKGVSSLGDWDNTPLGASLLADANALGREREAIASARKDMTDADEIFTADEALNNVTAAEADIAQVQTYINNLDLEADDLALKYQAAVNEGNTVEAERIKGEFDAKLAERARVLGLESVEEVFETTEGVTRATPAEPQRVDESAGTQEQAGTQQTTKQQPQPKKTKSTEANTGTQPENTPGPGRTKTDLEPEGDAPPNAESTEDKKWNWVNDEQRTKIGNALGLKGEDLDEEVQRRVNSGEFKVTTGGKLYRATYKELIGKNKAEPSTEAEDVVADAEPELPPKGEELPEAEQEVDVAEADESTAANQEAFDEATRKYEALLQTAKGSTDFIANMAAMVDELQRNGAVSGQVFRYLRQLLDLHAEAEGNGKNVVDADELVKMRKEFLAREGDTQPDIKGEKKTITGRTEKGFEVTVDASTDDATTKRSAGSTAKAQDALKEGVTTAGKTEVVTYDKKTGERIVKTMTQSFLKRGFDIGDGYAVMTAKDRFPKQQITLETLRLLARKEGENGQFVYAFRATGGEPVVGRVGVNKRMGRANKGEVLYYAPRTNRVYSTESMALKALGLKTNAKTTVVSDKPSAPDPEPATSGETVAARDSAFETFKKDGDFEKLQGSIARADKASGTNSSNKKMPEAESVDGEKTQPFLVEGLDKFDASGAIFAAIPRVEGKGFTRIIADSQDNPAQAMGKANPDDYFLGHVPVEARGYIKNRQKLLQNFKPFDEANDPAGVLDDFEPEVVRSPMPEAAARETIVSMRDLTKEQVDGLYLGMQYAELITPEQYPAEKFAVGKISLFDLQRASIAMTNLGWEAPRNFGNNSQSPLPYKMKYALMRNMYEVIDTYAPNGIRMNSTSIEDSMRSLRRAYMGAPKSSITRLGEMVKSVLPKGREEFAPIFRRTLGENYYQPTAEDGQGVANSINVDQVYRPFDENGISTEFIVAHEMGHWVWYNVLDTKSKLEFLKVAEKYYDENGKLYTDAYDEIRQKSPYISYGDDALGAKNFGDSFEEYFANQFALWLNGRNDMLSVNADGVFQKVAKIIRALVMKMSGKDIIDEDLVPLFEKLIVDDVKADRVKAMNPINDPQTDKGKSIRSRFVLMTEAYQSSRAAFNIGDLEGAAMHLSDLAQQFRGMSTSQKEAAFVARKKKEKLQPYTGAFQVVKRHHNDMKAMAQKIESVTRRFSMEAKTIQGEKIESTAFGTAMEEGVADIFENSDINKLIEDIGFTMNNAFLDVEMGDIPEYKLTQAEISRREALPNGFETIRRAQNFKRVKGRQNAAVKKRAAAGRAIKRNQYAKVKDPAPEKSDTPKFKINELDRESAVDAYYQSLNNGKETKTSQKLRAHIIELIRAMPDAVPTTDKKLAKTIKGMRTPEIMNLYNLSMQGVRGSVDVDPFEAEKIMRQIEFELQRRGKKMEVANKNVILAIETEQMFDGDDLPYTARNMLNSITHRNSEMQNASKKVAARMFYLGTTVSPDVRSDSFKTFRKEMRKIAAIVSRNGDLSEAVNLITKRLYNSNVLPTAQREVFRRGAGQLGYDPAEILADLVTEDVDINAPKSMRAILTDIDEDFAALHMFESLGEARKSMREAVSYVLNGLIGTQAARRRFAPLFTYGHMTSSNATIDPTSPKNKFADEIPSEFAEDYAVDYINEAMPSNIRAMQNFTGKKELVPYYVDISDQRPMTSGIRVNRTPMNKIRNLDMSRMSDEVVEVMGQLEEVRGNINMMRANNAPPLQIQKAYYLEQALREELTNLGGVDTSTVRAVLVRDTKPAHFSGKVIPSDSIVRDLSDAIKVRADNDTGITNAEQILDQLNGAYEPETMVDTLADAAGGTKPFESILRELGYTSLNVNGNKTMLNVEDIRDIRAPLFEEPDMFPTGQMPSDVIPHMVDAMETSLDGGDLAFSDTISALEIAGLPAKTSDVLTKIKKGIKITPKEGRELRNVAKFGLARNNAQRLAKSGMKTLAEFFQPSNAGAGHYERYALQAGQFLGALQRKLLKLPGTDKGMKRWFKNGLGEMLYAYNTTETIAGMLRIPAPTRVQPIISHLEVLNALRDETRYNTLSQQQREVYHYMRDYFKNARDRLVAAGYDVGNIKKNYVPQIWRRDLIEADREGFEDILARYFVAEHAERGAVLTQDDAILKAKGVADRLIHEDGVWTGDAHAFNRSGERGVDHVDYQRLIRLDEQWASRFNDIRDPSNNISKFLENDIMVIGAKYADSVEQRIDIANNFGVGGFGYYDYLAIMSGGLDAISKLLRSNKVLRKDYKLFVDPSNTQDEVAGEGASAIFNSTVFMAPIQDAQNGQVIAAKKAKELAQMAHDGKTSDEIFRNIMDMMEPKDGTVTSISEQMRKNFSFRARAIANALTDTRGLDADYMPQSHMVEEADNLYKATARKPVYNASFEKHLEKPSSWLRSFNSVTLLPFVTISSLGDVMLPLIRSGNLRASTEAYRKWMVDPNVGEEYREMIRNVGASTQNIVQERMSRSFGMDTTRFSAGFFTAIGLTDWTNTMRDISAATGYEWFKSQQEIAIRKPNTKAGRQARRVLDEYGLTDLYQRSGLNIERIVRSGSSADVDPLYYQVAGAMHRFANETIFTPNPLDIPLWAQSPIGQVIFQLKSFPLMMTRLGYKVYREAKDHQNFMPLLYFAGAPVLGAGVVATKDVVQARGGEENREAALRDRRLEFLKDYGLDDDEGRALALGWYRDGLMQMGGLGLIGSLMYDTASQLDNGAYGSNRIAELFLGPSLGILHDGVTVGGGLISAADKALRGEGTNGKQRAAYREVIGRVPVVGQITGVRETLVDAFGGKAGEN